MSSDTQPWRKQLFIFYKQSGHPAETGKGWFQGLDTAAQHWSWSPSGHLGQELVYWCCALVGRGPKTCPWCGLVSLFGGVQGPQSSARRSVPLQTPLVLSRLGGLLPPREWFELSALDTHWPCQPQAFVWIFKSKTTSFPILCSTIQQLATSWYCYWVMLLLDTLPALSKRSSWVTGPAVAHPLDFWDVNGMDVTIAEDKSRKGKITAKNSKD